MVSLWGRPWTRGELLARVGRLDQVAGVQLVEAGDGAERGVRLLRFTTGSGFGFDVLVDRGFDVGRAWLGGWPLAWWSPVGLIGPWLHDSAAGVVVSGSAIYDGADPAANLGRLLEQLRLAPASAPASASRAAPVSGSTPASAPAAPIPAPAHNPLNPVAS